MQPFLCCRTASNGKFVGGLKVSSVRDLGVGLDTSQRDGKATLPWTAGDLNVTLTFEAGATLTLRASGTEPKLKYYMEVSGCNAEDVADILEAAVEKELVRPGETGLAARHP